MPSIDNKGVLNVNLLKENYNNNRNVQPDRSNLHQKAHDMDTIFKLKINHNNNNHYKDFANFFFSQMLRGWDLIKLKNFNYHLYDIKSQLNSLNNEPGVWKLTSYPILHNNFSWEPIR